MPALTIKPLLVGVPEAAMILGIGRSTLYLLVKQGELHPIHIGRATRFTMAELESYVDRRAKIDAT